MEKLTSETSYHQLLTEVKEKIRNAQIRAMVTVNQELLMLGTLESPFWNGKKSQNGATKP